MSGLNSLNDELLLEHLKSLSHQDLKNACMTNNRIHRLCKKHETEIYENLLAREYGHWVSNPKLLFNAIRYENRLFRQNQHIELLRAKIDNNDTRALRVLIEQYKLPADAMIHSETLLMYALSRNQNEETISLLVDLSPDINATDTFNRYTALMRAVEMGSSLNILRKILSRNPNLTIKSQATGKSVFHIGFNKLDVAYEVVDMLSQLEFDVNDTDNTNNTPLSYAMSSNMSKLTKAIFKRLLDKGPNVNQTDTIGQTLLMKAIKGYHPTNLGYHIIKKLLTMGAQDSQDNDGKTVLVYALENPNFSKTLLLNMIEQHGMIINEPDDSYNTAFSRAVSRANEDGMGNVVLKMLELGGDIDSYYVAQGHETALMIALRVHATTDILEALIAKVNASNDLETLHRSQTNLMYACKYAYNDNSDTIINLILGGNSDINAYDQDGRTALMHAVMNNTGYISDETILRMLKIHGVNVNHQDDLGQNLMTYAVHNENPTRISIIRKLLRMRSNVSYDAVTKAHNNTNIPLNIYMRILNVHKNGY
jgi:ankyrin repeat protein